MSDDQTCFSCGSTRPAAQMIPALTFSWKPVPGAAVCRDADACFQVWSKIPVERLVARKADAR